MDQADRSSSHCDSEIPVRGHQPDNNVASAKFLGPGQRDQFLELSLSAAELYKRVQRNPRVARNIPILIDRETDSAGNQELANTVNVSKRGACLATSGLWGTGEKIWIAKPGNQETRKPVSGELLFRP